MKFVMKYVGLNLFPTEVTPFFEKINKLHVASKLFIHCHPKK
jgi:hypothetical protein